MLERCLFLPFWFPRQGFQEERQRPRDKLRILGDVLFITGPSACSEQKHRRTSSLCTLLRGASKPNPFVPSRKEGTARWSHGGP